MTFVKPSTIAHELGAYNYKGTMGSPAQNYIDNSFPNLLDKTGDTISGAVELSNTGSITALSGSAMTVDSGADLYIQGSLAVDNGGTEYFYSGSTLNMHTGSTATLQGSTTITFDSTQSSPTISQAITSSTPTDLTIQAQSSSGLFQPAGNLKLNSGSPGSGGTLGKVEIQTIYQYGALIAATTQNTQQGIMSRYMIVASTLASGSNVQLWSVALPNNTAAFITVSFVVKQNDGALTSSNRFADQCYGRMSYGTSGTAVYPTLKPSTGATGDTTISNYLTTSAVSNEVILTAVAQVLNMDWQVVVDLVLC